mgnify:FL=1
MDIKDCIIYEKTIPAHPALYDDFPENLLTELAGYLRKKGIQRLYCHQVEMFEKVTAGKHVVITTSTASGKTLSFLLPVVQEILKKPLTRAIFIYPTKALAADQYRAIRPFLEYFGENRIVAGVYDGDTPVAERTRIRQSANIILTNPEMVNGAFLPNHSKYGFDFLFSNLKYIVIDELHTYRGAFGSHLANVFRRLSRVCRYYHADPQFLCSSATIANPVELAAEICGKQFELVDKDGSPAAERGYYLIQPPKIMGKDGDYYGQVKITTVAAELLPELMDDGKNFIAFTKSRKNVEIVLKETRDRLEAEGFLGFHRPEEVSGYRGGYTVSERKQIESQMISGELMGLISTNALELGIDIGKISTTVLVGYPGTRASFWQQTGRAGRSGKRSDNYLILDQMPFDQYIALEPGWLFEGSSENAVIDKNNLIIELAHIRAAAAEIPLTLDDIALFPDLGEAIPVLLGAEELASYNGKFAWSGGEFPAGDFSMRNIEDRRYKLLHKDSGKEITEMDESQAFRELHEGAVYMHDGVAYQVTKLDLESRTAYAVAFNGNYYTVAAGETNVKIIHEQKNTELARTVLHFGDVNVSDYVYMFKKMQFHNHVNLGYESLPKALSKDYDTESVWMRMPENVVRVYRGLLQVNENTKQVRNNYYEGVCFALKNAARMVTMTEQEDIGVITSANALELAFASDSDVDLYFYDKYVGGLGFSEKIYDKMDEVIHSAVKLVKGCSCKKGCAACVGDHRLDKEMVLFGLENLLEHWDVPMDVKVAEYGPSTFRRKEFQFEKLEEQWDEFCKRIRENGESFAAFLQTVPSVEIRDRMLILKLTNSFYADWVMEPGNRTSLMNIVRYYADVPVGFQIQVALAEEPDEPDRDAMEKMKRRLHVEERPENV